MSNLYVSFTARAADANAVAAKLRALGRAGFVTPASDGFVVFYDAKADTDDAAEIVKLAQAASQALATSVLAVMNDDDEVLQYWVFDRGAQVDTYSSNPGYLDDSNDIPAGGDPDALCRAIADDADRAAIATILRAGNDEESDYPFAVDRHVALCEELGLPADHCALGHANVAEGSDEDVPGRTGFVQV